MKYLYVGVLILALLLFGCLASAWEINRRTQAVAEPLERALGALRVGDEAAGQRWAALAAAATLLGVELRRQKERFLHSSDTT